MMIKRVELEFDGSLEIGFRVALTLGEDGAAPMLRERGNLPPAPELLRQLRHHWIQTYRPLGAPYSCRWQGEPQDFTFRIKPKRVISGRPLQEQIALCHDSARTLTQHFNEWLMAKSFRRIDLMLREQLHPRDMVRLLLRTNSLEFKKLPWDEWDLLDRYPQAVASFSPLETREVLIPPITQTGTVRILAILGHSAGIDVERDRRLLQQLPYAEPVFLDEPTLQDINDRLWTESWDILFFAGHSETQGEHGVIHINPTESLTIEQLWYTLRQAAQRGLQLAIFNSCDGLGLSQRLDDLHIPQMILMRELVPDRVAHQFLTYFLHTFAAGEPLYVAVRQARQRLHDELERDIPCASWLPVICQNPLVMPPSWEQLAGQGEKPEPSPMPSPPQRPRPRFWGWGVKVGVLVTIAIVTLRWLGVFQPLEWWAYDTMLRSRPSEPQDSRIVIVEITDRDQRLNPHAGTTPNSITDEVLYRLLTKIESYQPSAIGLYKLQDGDADAQTPELQTYLKNTPHLYGVCQRNIKESGSSIPGSQYIEDERHGFGDITLDRDGVVRRQLLILDSSVKSTCHAINALSLKVAQHYFPTISNPDEQFTSDDILQFHHPDMDSPQLIHKLHQHRGFYHPQQDHIITYQILLNYRQRDDLKTIAQTLSVTDVLTLEDRQLDGLFRDRIVLIGVNRSASPTYQDINHQPIQPLFIQAHMVSQLLDAAIGERPILHLANPIQSLAWIGLWCLSSAGLMVLSWRISWRPIVAIGCLLGIAILLSWQSLISGLVLPIVPASLGLITVSLVMLYWEHPTLAALTLNPSPKQGEGL
ncbi:CHASE2 domain-containing protein [Spirulina major]|uniref:CHASE2 domain-containing protein n=1 Tax=Spirulina major TaxID=270636 RepID=UPI000933BDF2|nr:CHASE2 domain-containing protein [Spirulina major]